MFVRFDSLRPSQSCWNGLPSFSSTKQRIRIAACGPRSDCSYSNVEKYQQTTKNPEKLRSNGMQRVKETVPFDKLPALQCDGPAQVRSKALLKYE